MCAFLKVREEQIRYTYFKKNFVLGPLSFLVLMFYLLLSSPCLFSRHVYFVYFSVLDALTKYPTGLIVAVGTLLLLCVLAVAQVLIGMLIL